jgi:hypothetical protein
VSIAINGPLSSLDDLFDTFSDVEDFSMVFFVLSDELQEIKIPAKIMAVIICFIFW